ncbi:THAP domain-containing protein 3-like [Scleropages formosus]|uniref:THAP domain containing 3 n=1 Tax=Scleropages formosus TaxID=113540 RepID=A0A0P7V333_SCLFO|nr:THAP domain-containing protein 3-like [Scleropages formosus]XP_018617719.1 THAP domain-containing protein 3-like [Scleropages formosus]KPP76872.1 THAP domain-containing protein 3-like [Scleropages formosus]
MPKSCSAFNCTSRYSSKKPHVTFHRFPLSKPSVLKEWLENIGREDFQPKKHMVICSHHFTPDCFSSSGNRKNLLWNAVPTLFTSPLPNAKRRKSRKRMKCKKAHVLPKWEQLLLQAAGSEPEEVGLGENTVGIDNAVEKQLSSVLQHLPPIDHNYALPSHHAARTRLFSALDTIGWLRRKLKVKCQELRRMRLKLCACHRELASLRGRCLVPARLRFDQNGVARHAALHSPNGEKLCT